MCNRLPRQKRPYGDAQQFSLLFTKNIWYHLYNVAQAQGYKSIRDYIQNRTNTLANRLEGKLEKETIERATRTKVKQQNNYPLPRKAEETFLVVSEVFGSQLGTIIKSVILVDLLEHWAATEPPNEQQ